MAVRSTPLWIAGGCYTDVDLRAYFAMIGGACTAGGVRRLVGGEMAVTAPGGMNVAVAAGTGWVPGTDAAGQGMYLVDNATSTTVAITTANPTNPRIDRVVADVNDPAFTGTGTPVFTIAVIAGTPAGSPVAPAVPPSAIPLARVAVAAGAAAIVAGNITDERVFCDQAADQLMAAVSSTTLVQTSSVSYVDIAWAVVQWTGLANHLYKIHFKPQAQQNVATGNPSWRMLTGTSGSGGTVLAEHNDVGRSSPTFPFGDLIGYHTGVGALSAHCQFAVGAGRLDILATRTSWMTVEDMGLM